MFINSYFIFYPEVQVLLTEVIMEIPSLKITKRPESLVQVARDAIRKGIIRKELKLGQPLKEASLVQALEISNTPVREALSLLKSEG